MSNLRALSISLLDLRLRAMAHVQLQMSAALTGYGQGELRKHLADSGNLMIEACAALTPPSPAPADEKPGTPPSREGFWWAKWRIATDDTPEGDELTPSDKWEVVEVCDNNGEPGSGEEFMVSVPGVREAQLIENFFWGAEVRRG
jgi:hypothetical protein